MIQNEIKLQFLFGDSPRLEINPKFGDTIFNIAIDATLNPTIFSGFATFHAEVSPVEKYSIMTITQDGEEDEYFNL